MKVLKTPEERLYSYERLLNRYVNRDETEIRIGIYPYGICCYLGVNVPGGASGGRLFDYYPELKKVKPLFARRKQFWWDCWSERGYQKRLKAIRKMIKLVKKQINESQISSNVVSGNPSQPKS